MGLFWNVKKEQVDISVTPGHECMRYSHMVFSLSISESFLVCVKVRIYR